MGWLEGVAILSAVVVVVTVASVNDYQKEKQFRKFLCVCLCAKKKIIFMLLYIICMKCRVGVLRVQGVLRV